MKNWEILDLIQKMASEGSDSSDIGRAIITHHPEPITAFSFAWYFIYSFPGISLEALVQAGKWHEIGEGSLDDTELNRLLNPYIHALNESQL